MPRLFEQTENNNPDESYKISFGKAAVATLNMTFTNLFAYLRAKLTASESTTGLLEIATQTEVDAGTDDARAVTPLKLANYNSGVRQKIIDIGDWNMDTTATAPGGIAHGLDYTKIRRVTALIRNDANTLYNPLLDQSTNGNMIIVSSVNIVLSRQTGGIFDTTNYSTTSYNRGWIVIDYIP